MRFSICVINILSSIRELAVQGGSSTLTTADRNTIQVEIDAYLTEIDALTINLDPGAERVHYDPEFDVWENLAVVKNV